MLNSPFNTLDIREGACIPDRSLSVALYPGGERGVGGLALPSRGLRGARGHMSVAAAEESAQTERCTRNDLTCHTCTIKTITEGK